ncbi:transcription antitermination factor NusB, partial [Streptomyces sp. NPDC059346]
MAARNKARKRAFQILFEADQRGESVQTVLADWVRLSRTDDRQPPVGEFTMELVEGYAQYADRIDDLIVTYAVDWEIDRMPVVDRNILRLGAYELIWLDETPDAVVIDEAVQLAKEFSTDDSPS